MADQFFMVWNENGNAPTYKHPWRSSARQEAERLARMNPGEKFHVLRAEAVCVHSTVTWDEVDPNAPDEIPF